MMDILIIVDVVLAMIAALWLAVGVVVSALYLYPFRDVTFRMLMIVLFAAFPGLLVILLLSVIGALDDFEEGR